MQNIDDDGGVSCRDMSGRLVRHLEMFRPGPRGCCQCQCISGNALLCSAVPCRPEHCGHFGLVDPSCCDRVHQYSGGAGGAVMVDGGGLLPSGRPGGGGGGGGGGGLSGGTDLGLRLVASVVTAVLSLALLLFLVYRLRQRRHRAPAGTRADEAYNMSLMHYLRGSGYLSASRGGFNGSRDFFYQEPPPPYTSWKPAADCGSTVTDSAGAGGIVCVLPNEAPPPYSEAVAAPALRYQTLQSSRHCGVPDNAAAAALAAVVVTTAAAVERRRNPSPDVNAADETDSSGAALSACGSPPSPAPDSVVTTARCCSAVTGDGESIERGESRDTSCQPLNDPVTPAAAELGSSAGSTAGSLTSGDTTSAAGSLTLSSSSSPSSPSSGSESAV